MLVKRVHPISGELNVIELDVTEDQVSRFMSGEKVQKAFPNLNADQREYVLSGLLPDDWANIFQEDY